MLLQYSGDFFGYYGLLVGEGGVILGFTAKLPQIFDSMSGIEADTDFDDGQDPVQVLADMPIAYESSGQGRANQLLDRPLIHFELIFLFKTITLPNLIFAYQFIIL